MDNQVVPQDAEVVLGEDGKPLSKGALKKLQKQKEKEQKKKELEAKQAAEKAAREAASPDYSVGSYGKLPLMQSTERPGNARTKLASLNPDMVGETVLFSARVHTSRAAGSKVAFFVFRERMVTIQGVLALDADKVSKQMLKFAQGITLESIVQVEAEIVKPNELVKSCVIQDVELKILKIHVVSEAARLPISVEDASRPEPTEEEEANPDSRFNRVNLDTKLDNRVIDLRTTTNQAIFRIQAGVGQLFREFLENKGFIEIHSPKLIGAASEGGANVFKIPYFKTFAYLAQSPQFYKQMMICSDYERVYEIAPVFRAENSFTHRHMTEFMGLDLEMTIEEHYHEALDLFDGLFVHIFKGLETRFADEIAQVKKQYPFEDFKYREKTLVLEFPEAVRMLREAGAEMGDFDDLTTANERLLGRLVREKYDTDFFFLDKFPLAVRPFYTMPDPARPGYSNSYDFFIRGEEILSGAQRIHDYDLLVERIKEHEVDPATVEDYINAFKYGAPPHAGGGIGLERVIMLYLNLGNIRKTSLFPRDPKRLFP
ncbi:uncharacterized protein BJ171DRAFT_423444 [Polychytrium aggregatum]|uniref:uncharacterized protein n=1 Tax=Polychytrium aggregatum TaxID=110093 RepID=UPI0022FE58C1|nr:uncharacterized protein BJ171DRAFT_423444 [Polychytrium aggregatum]KAI9205038.1 hypothetical protein BJ171DRAFT_423444 [Polychytrium aggregatum]